MCVEVEGSARTKTVERVSGNGNFEQTYFRTALLLDLSLISPIRYMKNAANFGKISRSKKLQTQGQCQIEFFFIYGTILCDQPSIIKIETACTTFGHEIINWLLLNQTQQNTLIKSRKCFFSIYSYFKWFLVGKDIFSITVVHPIKVLNRRTVTSYSFFLSRLLGYNKSVISIFLSTNEADLKKHYTNKKKERGFY